MQTRRGLGLVLACAGAIVSTHLHPSPRPGYQHQPSAISTGISIGQARSSFPWNVSCFRAGGGRRNLHLVLSLFSLSLFPHLFRMSEPRRADTGTWGVVSAWMSAHVPRVPRLSIATQGRRA